MDCQDGADGHIVKFNGLMRDDDTFPPGEYPCVICDAVVVIEEGDSVEAIKHWELTQVVIGRD